MSDKTQLPSARLKSWQIWLLAVSGGVLWASGAAWLVLYYFLRHHDEINPAELTMMQIHGAAMPAALLAVGGLLVAHIPKGWSYRRQRGVGIFMAACVTVMIITSYFLHYVADDDVRGWISIIHWVMGLGLPVVFAFHWANGRAVTRKAS